MGAKIPTAMLIPLGVLAWSGIVVWLLARPDGLDNSTCQSIASGWTVRKGHMEYHC